MYTEKRIRRLKRKQIDGLRIPMGSIFLYFYKN